MTTLTLNRPAGDNVHTMKRALVPAAVALVLATPVATWWLVGDQSTVPASAGRDFAFRPWNISPGVTLATGIASLALAVGTLTLLAWATRRHVLGARWWSVLIPLLGAGVIAGFGWRVMTAGVIGANIGAGLAVFFGGPVVAGLVAWALARSAYLVTHDRTGRR